MNTRNISWLAGLLEGEGCFSKRGNCVTIQLYMSDLDIVERSQKLVGALSIGSRKGKTENHKTCFYWSLAGPRAAEWMMTLYPLMGQRRQARIKGLLEIFKTAKKQTPSVLVCTHTEGHRKRRTVCDKCYQADWYRQRKEGRRDVSSLANSII